MSRTSFQAKRALRSVPYKTLCSKTCLLIDIRAMASALQAGAIDVGWTGNPIISSNLKRRAYFLFAGSRLLWIPIFSLFISETKDRPLELIEALLISHSPFSLERKSFLSGAGRHIVGMGSSTRQETDGRGSRCQDCQKGIEDAPFT